MNELFERMKKRGIKKEELDIKNNQARIYSLRHLIKKHENELKAIPKLIEQHESEILLLKEQNKTMKKIIANIEGFRLLEEEE